MNEPTLREMSDYQTLEGEKKRVVLAVILAGLILGTIFSGAKWYFSDEGDAIATGERIGQVPFNASN